MIKYILGTSNLTSDSVLAHDIAKSIKNVGFNFFVSVPCGILSPLLEGLKNISNSKEFLYMPREDTALGVACGANTKFWSWTFN